MSVSSSEPGNTTGDVALRLKTLCDAVIYHHRMMCGATCGGDYISSTKKFLNLA